jgi:phosphate transport system permease protein
MHHSYYRRVINILGLGFSILSTLIVLFFLFWILIVLFYKGLQEFNFSIFTQNTPPPGEAGGLLNALWGSFLITGFAILIATPIGVLAGTFLAEFTNKTKFAQITRFINDILLSAPSIVIGLFVYSIYVKYVGHFSGWAGVFALVIIAIPLILRTTDDILRLVPNQLREASAALGAPHWMTITHIVFRVATSGIITGILLAIARISGETAPLLFTALNNDFFSSDLNKPMANLPNTIFKFAMSPFESWQHLAWQAVFILIVWVLFCNILVRVLFKAKLKLR